MIVLGVDRRAARANRIGDVLALLVLPRQFLDRLNSPRITRSGIGPVGLCSHPFAVYLGGHGTTAPRRMADGRLILSQPLSHTQPDARVSCGRGRPAGGRGPEDIDHVGAEPDHFGSLAGR